MKLKSIFSATILSMALVSCNEGGDTTKPLIKLINPAVESAVKPGSEMCVLFDLSDDVALESFKINIHNAFDGHHHDSKAFNTDTANAFSYNETSETLEGQSISGLRNIKPDVDIEIPASAACGDYHLMIYCYDAAGNTSEVSRSFQITENGEVHEHEHDHE